MDVPYFIRLNNNALSFWSSFSFFFLFFFFKKKKMDTQEQFDIGNINRGRGYFKVPDQSPEYLSPTNPIIVDQVVSVQTSKIFLPWKFLNKIYLSFANFFN